MKKTLTLFAFPALLCLMPLTTCAEVINTVISSENITKTSTVYVGEVIVDGESQIKYLYSGDVTINNTVMQNLLAGLNGMADTDFAALLEENRSGLTQAKGFALCDDPELADAMDGNWSSAQYVGTLYFPDKSIISEINSNLYDIDEGFKAAVDARNEEIRVGIDNIADVEKCIVSHLDGHSTNNVYYTDEDGQLVKHVETNIVYDAEATTVIYTKVELTSGSTSTVLGDVDGDGTVSVTDVAWIVNHILGVSDDNFIIANADINGDGEIDVNDVMATVSIILEGDNTPQAYLTCPDEHHPHMIDLGLPSGTLWACCNVDATTPEGNGGYYAWGETEEKSYYEWDSYIYCDGSYGTCHDIGSDIAGTKYDVAHVKWGGSWVMPSKDQFEELRGNCTFEWTTENGVNGGKISGSNGGTIFLPATGYFWGDDITNGGSRGCYWLSTLNPSNLANAYHMGFYSGGVYLDVQYGRRCGRCVRPVFNK